MYQEQILEAGATPLQIEHALEAVGFSKPNLLHRSAVMLMVALLPVALLWLLASLIVSQMRGIARGLALICESMTEELSRD